MNLICIFRGSHDWADPRNIGEFPNARGDWPADSYYRAECNTCHQVITGTWDELEAEHVWKHYRSSETSSWRVLRVIVVEWLRGRAAAIKHFIMATDEESARFDRIDRELDLLERHTCPGCRHPAPDPHVEREGGAWCKRDMDAASAAGDDPRSVGPCY